MHVQSCRFAYSFQPIAFLTFSLSSPLWHLKVPNDDGFPGGAKRRPEVRLCFAGHGYMVVFSCYFMVPETPADQKVPFFEVG